VALVPCATGAPELVEPGFSRQALARIESTLRVQRRRSHRLRRALPISIAEGMRVLVILRLAETLTRLRDRLMRLVLGVAAL